MQSVANFRTLFLPESWIPAFFATAYVRPVSPHVRPPAEPGRPADHAFTTPSRDKIPRQKSPARSQERWPGLSCLSFASNFMRPPTRSTPLPRNSARRSPALRAPPALRPSRRSRATLRARASLPALTPPPEPEQVPTCSAGSGWLWPRSRSGSAGIPGSLSRVPACRVLCASAC